MNSAEMLVILGVATFIVALLNLVVKIIEPARR